VLLIALWQVAASRVQQPSLLPTPLRVILIAETLIANGDLPLGILQSLGRVFAGFGVAASIAIPLGLMMGAVRAIERNLDPIVESFRPVAAIAILPLAILWFGTGTPAAVFIVAYAAFFPLLVNTVAGVKRVDRRLVDAARTMGVRRFAILRTVVVPGALPQIGVGLRLALGVAWTAIIAAELAVGAKAGGGATGGIGQMMFVFYAYSVELNSIIVCMLAVGLVALGLDRGLRLALARAMPWGRR
jgi:ABC-type nitrate/sulfonate/bicarbonate transport system permease component